MHIQQTLAVDSAELFTAGINTHAGEQAVLTVIRANKQTIKEELK
ncbi:putative tail length tape measure protein [Pasteurella multocida subsp. multocida str. Anand1_cattle]|nr:putative tail length tape measure protein [Pasteurella multocida subsp. multocida str. Anand1_cattle]